MLQRRPTLLVSLLVVVVSVLAAGAVRAEDPAYVIGAGDVLEIQVWDNKALDQTVFVRPDGKVSLPLVGEVQAGGQTVREFQDALAQAYVKMVKAASVTVIVKEIRSRPVYFVGGFAKPGVEQLTRDLTLMQAISIAGGLLPAADGENAFVLRGGRRLPVDLTRLIQKGDVSQNLRLEVGDSVVVPIADAVYVQGEVKNPGAVKATTDLTVLKAISQVGGLTQLAAAGRVEILRGEGDKKERIKVDLDQMRKSPAENTDVRLKPNDIVFVPQRLF
jgi:polysaccharide export outer membrane protein